MEKAPKNILPKGPKGLRGKFSFVGACIGTFLGSAVAIKYVTYKRDQQIDKERDKKEE